MRPVEDAASAETVFSAPEASLHVVDVAKAVRAARRLDHMSRCRKRPLDFLSTKRRPTSCSDLHEQWFGPAPIAEDVPDVLVVDRPLYVPRLQGRTRCYQARCGAPALD